MNHFRPKNDIFLAVLSVFGYFLSFKTNFWVSEGQNEVSVESKNVETLVLGHFQGIFEKINKKSKTLKQAKK